MYKKILIMGLALVILFSLYLTKPPIVIEQKLKKFSSYDELNSFVKRNTETYIPFYTPVLEIASAKGIPATIDVSEDYSTTNVQVTGVDEADIIKNDGKYLYVVSGRNVIIIDAYPAEDAKILSKIELNGVPYEIFINGDKLVVFGSCDCYGPTIESVKGGIGRTEIISHTPKTFIKVYDISDRENPVLKRNVSVDGNYFDSRMIGDYVYVIINQPIYYGELMPLPTVQYENKLKTIPASEIYYFDFPDSSYIYTNILSINTQKDEEEISIKTFLLGYSQNMYVSTKNIFIVYTKTFNYLDFYDKVVDKLIPIFPAHIQAKIREIKNSDISKQEKIAKIEEEFRNYINSLNPEEATNFMKIVEERVFNIYREIEKEVEKTIIHKISVENEKIEYKASGEVPGYILNQFSMDEYNSYFRIATTTGWINESLNHVYILDDGLKIVGKIEDLASGERIYSVRFIGDKGYVVTFRQIDPLFVIDLGSPNNPKVLGYLKITGVSDYLHPYDETHLIGVGRDATEEGRIKGMKLSLFDITDVSNPKEISKYIIGERGTDSDALRDHKAFLFSKSKNILVIPLRVIEGENIEEKKWNVWQGAYVFNVDLENGFVLKGKVTHTNKTEEYYDYLSRIKRSLYIDDVLYTFSDRMIKMNELTDLKEINGIELPSTYR
ncbi:MAG: beta-propeller domain-containing protein [Candidatus Aenigmatarchaeota archaeon]